MMRGAVASSRAGSQSFDAHAMLAPGRAGTSQRTGTGEKGTVTSLQRVVPSGETATATRTSRMLGSGRPWVETTAPPADARDGRTREATTEAARNAKRRDRGRKSAERVASSVPY